MATKTTGRITLGTLTPAPGSTQKKKRVGRGPGSGIGKTSGKGHKGQKARAGGHVRPGFEGGQMPMYRRLPNRGFTNPFKVTFQVVNLRQLDKVAGGDVNPETLHAAALVSEPDRPVKLLGTGEATRAFTVRGLAVSASAKAKIEAAGGTVEAV